MPANRCDDPSWNPRPDFQSKHSIEPALDARVFDIDNPADIATCLLETSPDIEVYRWDMSDEELTTLALESARLIISKRRELYVAHQLAQEFESAKARRDARINSTASDKSTTKPVVIAGYTENLETGEVSFYTTEVNVRRTFG